MTAQPLAAAQPRQDRLTLAFVIMAGAFFSFTMIDSLAKWLVAAGFSALNIVFVRYAGHFLTSLAIFVPREGRRVFRSHAPRLQAVRAMTLLSGTILNFVALSHLPLTVTTAIFFAAPIVVCLLAIPMLGERIGPFRLSAVAFGFVGVLIITRPWGAAFHWALFCSLGALMAASLYFVLTRMIAGRDDNPTGQLITSGLPTLVLLPVVFLGWTWPERAADWAAVLAIGCFGTVGHSLLTVAHRYAEASVLAPMVYVQILYVTVISWAVFHQPPDGATILGTAVIVASGLVIWWRERAVRARAGG